MVWRAFLGSLASEGWRLNILWFVYTDFIVEGRINLIFSSLRCNSIAWQLSRAWFQLGLICAWRRLLCNRHGYGCIFSASGSSLTKLLSPSCSTCSVCVTAKSIKFLVLQYDILSAAGDWAECFSLYCHLTGILARLNTDLWLDFKNKRRVWSLEEGTGL